MDTGDPSWRSAVGTQLVGEFGDSLPRLPNPGVSLCSACDGIKLGALRSGRGYQHSPCYHALLASAIHIQCPVCMLLLQALHARAGIGSINTALVMLDPLRTDLAIHLRAGLENEIMVKVEVSIENGMPLLRRGILMAFALPGTIAARQNLQTWTPSGGAEKLGLIKTWVYKQLEADAEKIYPEIRVSRTNSVASRRPLPSRLLDVQELRSGSVNGVRLVETSTLQSQEVLYVALSYRWGATNVLQTLASTLCDRLAFIPLEIIPKTIRDAISVTRHLGVKYLWVDALCIIQDDDDDWNREAAKMGDVYMNAHCTIAAHAAEHADHGFLEESLKRETAIAIGGHHGQEPYVTETTAYETMMQSLTKEGKEVTEFPFESDAFFVTVGRLPMSHLDATELSSRGWVLQERLLSRRIIHFAKNGAVYFESQTGVEHIDAGVDVTYRPFAGLRDALQSLSRQQDSTSLSDGPTTSPQPSTEMVSKIRNSWYALVARYSRCILTKPKDKLIAISGIARKCRDLTDERYMAGVWCSHVHTFLLWQGTGDLVLPPEQRAPTWSWAHLDGSVQYPSWGISGEDNSLKAELRLAGVSKREDIQLSQQDDSGLSIFDGHAVLELDNVVKIETGLRFGNFRVGMPFWDHVMYTSGELPTRLWDVYSDGGNVIGWASLDLESRQSIDGNADGIICIKVASNGDDRIQNGFDRGYMVLFVARSDQEDVWARIGMGQITDRQLFDGRITTKMCLI